MHVEFVEEYRVQVRTSDGKFKHVECVGVNRPSDLIMTRVCKLKIETLMSHPFSLDYGDSVVANIEAVNFIDSVYSHVTTSQSPLTPFIIN